jgi:hypothetical protein
MFAPWPAFAVQRYVFLRYVVSLDFLNVIAKRWFTLRVIP